MKLFTIMIASLVSWQVLSADAAKKLDGKVKVDGSSTVYPISEAMAEEFQKLHPRVQVTVGISGTGGGMKKFGAGEIDIANASRAIKENEVADLNKNKISYVELWVGFDGLSVVVNKKNPLDSLTMDQLKKLWQPNSKVKTWADLGLTKVKDQDFLKSPVKLYGPGPDSGTFDFFTKEVMGKSGASRSDYTASEDDNVAVRGIVPDPNAMGYFGYAYYLENANQLKVLSIDAGKGEVKPTMETIENGAYPLARPLYIYVSQSAAQKSEIREFVTFYLKNAEAMTDQVGYTPLASKKYEEQLAKFVRFAGQKNKSTHKPSH